jgi:hypothetical protein
MNVKANIRKLTNSTIPHPIRDISWHKPTRSEDSSACLEEFVMLPKPEFAYFAIADISGYTNSSQGSNSTMRRTS